MRGFSQNRNRKYTFRKKTRRSRSRRRRAKRGGSADHDEEDDMIQIHAQELNDLPESEFVDLYSTLKTFILKSTSKRRATLEFYFTHTSETGATYRGEMGCYYNSPKFPSPYSPDGCLVIQTVFVTPQYGGVVTTIARQLLADEELRDAGFSKVVIESVLSQKWLDNLVRQGWTRFLGRNVYLTAGQ